MKIRAVARMRELLDEDVASATRFARCQLRDPGGWYNVSHTFDGVWEGEAVQFDPVLRPLFLDYAARLYGLAAQEAAARFPDWTDYVIEEGPDLGERRLMFPNREHHLALSFVINRMRTLHEEKAVCVSERVRVEPEDRFGLTGDRRRRLSLIVTLDRRTTDKFTWEEVRAGLGEGQGLPVDPTPRQCDFDLVAPMQCEMSPLELIHLNWDVIRKPLSEADKALFEAAETFEPSIIAACLAAGADPNAFNDRDETPFSVLADSDLGECLARETGEKWKEAREQNPPIPFERRKACMEVLLAAGADIDLAGPEGVPALVEAVLRKDDRLLEWLLELGADDTIDPFDDSSLSDWPAAWDYAITDTSVEPGPESERTWRTLRRHRQAPDGTLPHERPEW